MLARTSYSRMNSASQPALLVPGYSVPAVVPARGMSGLSHMQVVGCRFCDTRRGSRVK